MEEMKSGYEEEMVNMRQHIVDYVELFFCGSCSAKYKEEVLNRFRNKYGYGVSFEESPLAQSIVE